MLLRPIFEQGVVKVFGKGAEVHKQGRRTLLVDGRSFTPQGLAPDHIEGTIALSCAEGASVVGPFPRRGNRTACSRPQSVDATKHADWPNTSLRLRYHGSDQGIDGNLPVTQDFADVKA